MLNVDAMVVRLRQIIADCTLVPAEAVGYNTEFRNAGVDSLSLLRVVAATEEEFGIRLPDERFEGIRSLRDLVAEVIRAGATIRGAPPHPGT